MWYFFKPFIWIYTTFVIIIYSLFYILLFSENRKNMHGGKIFFSGVGLFYIYQNLDKDVNFQDSLRKFQDLSCM
jgi:hypothetical protein